MVNNFLCDHRIVSQSMLPGALEKGLGGCIFVKINWDKLKELLNQEDHLDVLLVIAIVKPKEEIVIKDVEGDNIMYYRDEKHVRHVPKWKIEELIINY